MNGGVSNNTTSGQGRQWRECHAIEGRIESSRMEVLETGTRRVTARPIDVEAHDRSNCRGIAHYHAHRRAIVANDTNRKRGPRQDVRRGQRRPAGVLQLFRHCSESALLARDARNGPRKQLEERVVDASALIEHGQADTTSAHRANMCTMSTIQDMNGVVRREAHGTIVAHRFLSFV